VSGAVIAPSGQQPMSGAAIPRAEVFPPGYRASGVLLHVSSLPAPYGIGDLGPASLAWIDLLHDTGQSWWQALPLGPTGYGDSPYQPLSSFAGNELLLSPDRLIEDGMLRAEDCACAFPANVVDYGAVLRFKRQLLEKAWHVFGAGARPDLRSGFEKFCDDQKSWLEDYALFRALKARHRGVHYLQWPAELVRRDPAAMAVARRELADVMDLVRFAQYLLFRQGRRVKEHARDKGVRLLGDVPFFVSPDSSDVWANPELFLLDHEHKPRFVAGVPPDYFSADGQLWGNPVYDWDALRQRGYRWWLDRLGAWLSHVDVLRLDHFRAFAAAWHVPAGSPTAQTGQWLPGPGADFFFAVERELGTLPFVAEDLGLITPDVHALRDQFQLAGTRVLQFAFDGGSDNPHLPQNFAHNTVAYTGTHDNPTTRAWFETLPEDQKQNVRHYVAPSGIGNPEAVPALVGLVWESPAAIAMAPLQDLLNLGAEAQMNAPGRAEGNWSWRCTDEMMKSLPVQWLRDLTLASNRTSGQQTDGKGIQP